MVLYHLQKSVTSNEMNLCLRMLNLNKPRLNCFAAELYALAQVTIDGHSHLNVTLVVAALKERKWI
jgi:hypothetical protein